MSRLTWTLFGICVGMFLSQIAQRTEPTARKSRTPEEMSPTFRNMATQDTDVIPAPEGVKYEARALVQELVQPNMTELEANNAREILTLQLFNAVRDEAGNRNTGLPASYEANER